MHSPINVKYTKQDNRMSPEEFCYWRYCSPDYPKLNKHVII